MRRRSLSVVSCTCLASAALLTLGLSACQSTNLGGQLVPPGYKAATRNASECAAVRAKAPSTDTTAMQMPSPSMLSLPTEPLPKDLLGKSVDIRLHVNENGRVIGEGLRVEGIGEHKYVPFLIEKALRYRFWPAVLEGCAVPAWTSVHLDFPTPP